MHKSGFVNIIGKPNVGKSTLMNALLGERMSVITHKPQTTRHRILGILSDDDYQIIFSDTPGYIDDPAYKMQESMNSFVHSTKEDGDIMIIVIDPTDPESMSPALENILKSIDEVPLFLVLNKVDLLSREEVLLQLKDWSTKLPFTECIPISALKERNVDQLIKLIIKHLPEGPVYYPKDQLTDRSERFFVSEIIRSKILLLYKQEIPYSVEVAVTTFKEKKKSGNPLVHIEAQIFIARKSQKSILIGKNGAAIKKLGMASRKDIEQFLNKRVYLDLHVKLKENWRDDDQSLKYFGYKN